MFLLFIVLCLDDYYISHCGLFILIKPCKDLLKVYLFKKKKKSKKIQINLTMTTVPDPL